MSSGGLVEAFGSGDRLRTFEALRDYLAARLAACNSDRDAAALSNRLMDVLEQIGQLVPDEKPEQERTGLSEFERKLAERQSGSSGKAGVKRA